MYPKNRNSQSRRLTNEQFLEKMKIIKPDFEVLEKYILHQVKIKFRHKVCGTIFSATPNNMLHKNYGGCPVCGQENRTKTKRLKSNINFDIIDKKVHEVYNDKYLFIREKSEYINNKKKTIILKCSECLEEFSISYVNLCKGRGCPFCDKYHRADSKGVKEIIRVLNEENITFVREWKDENCKNVRTLPFDFKIDKKDGSFILIEYDGEQHEFGFNRNSESLKNIQQRDEIKNKFCQENNISLLRITYKDNIEEKVKQFIGVEFRD